MNEDWKNPYIAGSPIRGEEMFFGRDNVFAWLRTHLIGQFQDNAIVLYGERRTGKTSILYQMSRGLDDPTYIPILIDLQQLSLDSTSSFLWQVAVKIWDGLRRVEGVSKMDRPQRESFAEAPSVHFEEVFLTRVQEAIGQRKLVVMFDEFSRMRMKVEAGDLPSDVFGYLRSLMADHRLTLIVSLGSKLEEMNAEYAVLFNQAIYHQITFLDEADARALVTQPVVRYYTYQDEAVNLILKATSGHPFYIQHICHAIFARRKAGGAQPVTAEEVVLVLPDVVEATAPHLKFVWDDIGSAEKAVLAAMATLVSQVGGAISQADTVRLLRDNDVCPPDGELTSALQTLRTRDILLESTPGEYTFAVEPLRLWLSKERRLDFVRQELVKENTIDRWQQVAPPPLPWWRQPKAALLATTLLLIIGLSGALSIWMNRQMSLKEATATAAARATDRAITNATATGIAEAQATRTEMAQATAEAEATAEARARATTIANAIIVFEDDFSSNVNGWWVGEASGEYADYEDQVIDGKYRRSMVSKKNGVSSWSEVPNLSAKDFWLSVETTIVESSADAEVKFSFRENKYGDYYLVQFANDGSYRVRLWKDGEWTTIQGQGASDAIRLEPGITNTFAILVTGSSFTLYANEQELGTVTDIALSDAGEIALAIGLAEANQTLAVDFDNLVVKEVPVDKSVAEIKGTATARAIAKATAYAEPTVTAVARATTIANAIVVFKDDFSSNVNGWWVGKDSGEYGDSVDQVIDGKYRRSYLSKEGVVSRRGIPDLSVREFWLSVEATIVEVTGNPGDADVSITFRKDKKENYYRVQFANDGSYRVRLRKDGKWTTIQGQGSSDAIRLEPGITNTFAILVTGSSFTLYANEQELGTVTDTVLSEAGEIGLALGLDEANQTLTVDFDNLVVKEVPVDKTVLEIEGTATARAIAKATAYAEPTVTAVARAAAIANAIVVFEDDFSSNVNGWWVGEFSDEYGDDVAQIVEGKYHRSLISKRDVIWRQSIPDFSIKDFWLSVEATIVETSAEAGEANVSIIFREDKKGNYYGVQFANDGTYRVWLWEDGKWTTIQGQGSSDVIRLEPGVTNTFAILVTDSDFTIYANGQELGTVTDTALSEAGEIGLALGLAEANQALTVDFDNLVVKKVP